jgi:hypothetical protein
MITAERQRQLKGELSVQLVSLGTANGIPLTSGGRINAKQEIFRDIRCIVQRYSRI